MMGMSYWIGVFRRRRGFVFVCVCFFALLGGLRCSELFLPPQAFTFVETILVEIMMSAGLRCYHLVAVERAQTWLKWVGDRLCRVERNRVVFLELFSHPELKCPWVRRRIRGWKRRAAALVKWTVLCFSMPGVAVMIRALLCLVVNVHTTFCFFRL